MNSIRSYFENKNLKYKNTEDNSTISTNNRNLLLLKTGNGNLASSTADTIAIREGSSDTVFGGSIEIRTTSSPRRAASRTCSISDVNPATYQENSRDELTETVREEGLMVLEEEKSKPEEREIVIAGVRSEMEEETLARVPSYTLVEFNRMDQEERWEQDRKKKAVLVELNRMGQDGALVELNRMDQEGNREQEGIKKTVLVELNRMDQDSTLVELNRMDQEGNGEQDGIKKAVLVELNRMDQDSALVELNRMDQEGNGEQDEIKINVLVELNRMDQDSALVELNRMDQEENGEQDGIKKAVLVEVNRMDQDSALVELNRMDQEENREQRLSEAKLDKPCSFNKRGKCLDHNLVGKKTVLKTKKWVRMKDGFGWVTRQTTVYTCIADKTYTAPQLNSEEVSSTSPELGKR